jgi:pimeloyl-ACP methyl ester carboxylesterase
MRPTAYSFVGRAGDDVSDGVCVVVVVSVDAVTRSRRATTQLPVPIDIGRGPAVVVLHGFGMQPGTYAGLADQLAEHCRVLVPDLFGLPGRWRASDVVDGIIAVLDVRRIDRVSFIGHSFGGAIELRLAASAPDRVAELVFSDTLAASEEWALAREALSHPVRVRYLATPAATTAFLRSALTRPARLARAGWWAFRDDRTADTRAVAAAGIPVHVLWANRDSILNRADGERFAADLGTSLVVASGPNGRVLDHDWMFEQPQIFLDALRDVGFGALG